MAGNIIIMRVCCELDLLWTGWSCSKLNEKKATLSPHNSAQNCSENLIGQGKAQLENATHLSQYFDRETDQAMAKFAKQAFADFIEHGDIERLVGQLEKQRKKVFPQQ